MLTPRFKLSQDEDRVFITVHAPYTNVADTEIDVDGENFLFVSSPYFLRLRLPGRIIENDNSKGSYVCDTGDFNLSFEKENLGEHFDNLDMITSLLAPRDIPDVNPSLVEMLEEDGITIEDEKQSDADINKYAFGFANKISTGFQDIGDEFPQIFELRVPENIALDERHKLRMEFEAEKFSSDHYLADLYEDELIIPYLETQPYWEASEFYKISEFTDDELSILKELPNKHYLLTKSELKQVLYSLVDILYGYCYDKRTTLNESTVESSWTINKLSSTLSWFCTFTDLKQALVACYRRALVYPIFRNFDLCVKVQRDVTSLIKKGKKFIVKCLIDIHQMFNTSNDARYILNQLYIKDYLVFLQKCKNEDLVELYNNLVNTEIEKKDLDLDLVELEEAAEMVEKEESELMANEVAQAMGCMSLNNGPIEEGDESDSSSDSSSDDSSSDSDDSDVDSDDDPS